MKKFAKKNNGINKIFINCLVVMVSILVGFFILEIIIRSSGMWISFPPDKRNYYRYSQVDNIPYTLKPNMHLDVPFGQIISNENGFRINNLKTEQKGEIFRLLVIGDSYVFGFGVDQDDAFPQQLECLLNNRKKKKDMYFEVLNAGIDGYNVMNQLHALKYTTSTYSPGLIIWLLTTNDWDDSLKVNKNGYLISNHKEYSATSSWLKSTWGWDNLFCDADNFYTSIDSVHQAWANNKPYNLPLSVKIDHYLKKHVHLYAYLSKRLFNINLPPKEAHSQRVYMYEKTGFKDTFDYLGIYPITLSPYYNERFYHFVNEGVSYTKKKDIPIIILGMNIPFDTNKLKYDVIYEDITQYFNMPTIKFFLNYNLVWDGHCNSKGNKIIAESIIQTLIKNGLLKDVQSQKNTFYSKIEYWKKYKQFRNEFIKKHIKPFIDFKHFKNIHQLIGGLYPPRRFPIKGGAKLSLILKPIDKANLFISGRNEAVTPIKVLVRIGTNGLNYQLNLQPGIFNECIQLKHIDWEKHTENNIFDVQLTCLTEQTNLLIQLDYIGFKDSIFWSPSPLPN